MSSGINSTANGGPLAIRLCTALIIICTIVVGLRIWGRKFKGNSLAVDDWTIIFALVLAYGIEAIQIISVHYGLGQHVGIVEANIPGGILAILKCLLALQFLYTTSIATIKISVLLMYHRIFSTGRSFRNIGIVLSGTVIMWWTAVMLTILFQCTPVKLAYDKSLSGHCIDTSRFYLGVSIPNIITDVAIIALPVREVWKLQMPRAQKVAILGMFLMGGLIVVASIVRLIFLFQLAAESDNPDITWIFTTPWIWSAVEPMVGIISACLPTLRPIAQPCLGRTPLPSQNFSSGLQTIGGTGGKRTWPKGKTEEGQAGSFERLHGDDANDITMAALTPEGYANERWNGVSTSRQSQTEGSVKEYPMDGIKVKVDVDWKEEQE